ncbi:Rab family GTPase [Candidatus Lokiarchaeum ossiferum]|uniref:Rab family GTPase n=1 Tax=Candidatus Lokiarchaeum ossiferum TaxID=2951803 RepID=UPI00352CC6A8
MYYRKNLTIDDYSTNINYEEITISTQRKQYKFKIPLFGSQNVGKTSLILRFIKHSFSLDLKQTIGTNFLIKDVEIEGNDIRLMIWDIGGQAQFSTMRNIYFKGSQGAIGVYDITMPESLLRLPGWTTTMQNAAGNIPLIVIGNKIDIAEEERRVNREEAEDLTSRLNATHIETSAKDGTNVEEMFMEIARQCYENAKRIEADQNFE